MIGNVVAKAKTGGMSSGMISSRDPQSSVKKNESLRPKGVGIVDKQGVNSGLATSRQNT